MARSKMFKNPPESLIPLEEQKLIKSLTEEYMMRMRALHFYLHEDDLKVGDKGEAALIAAEKEEQIHIKNLQKNEEENARQAELRAARLAKESEERKVSILRELEEFENSELERLAQVDNIVEKHKLEMEKRIEPEDLEKAIETALANPVDYEFAIDLSGNIFRGRTTKSKKIKPEDLEKLPVASEN